MEYGNERRLNLRATLTSIFSKARELKVNAVTIGGDLFAQEYLLSETADFIHQQLTLLDPIRVIVAPGNQDPYTNESIYAHFDWTENVDIFYNNKLTHKELTPDVHLWGACNPSEHRLFDNFQPRRGVNILLLHAVKKSKGQIHAIDTGALENAGFRLALLGGEHVSEVSQIKNLLVVYPGSPEPLSPLEQNGLHQVALIEIDGHDIHVKYLSFQQWHYHNVEVDLSSCISNIEAARYIDDILMTRIAKTPHAAIAVALNGQLQFDLDILQLTQLIQTSAFIHLESNFALGYDVEQLANEQTVRGLLVQRFRNRVRSAANESERQQLLTALQFALQALDGKPVSLYETNSD